MDTAPRAGHTAQTNIENSYFDPKLRIYAFQMKKIQKFVLFEFGSRSIAAQAVSKHQYLLPEIFLFDGEIFF